MLSWPSSWASGCTGTIASGTASVLIPRSYARTAAGPGGHADPPCGVREPGRARARACAAAARPARRD